MTGATSFELEVNGNVTPLTATSRVLSNLRPNRLHTFRVRALNAGGAGSFSPLRSFITRRASNTGNNHRIRRSHFNGRVRQSFGDPVDAVSNAFLWDYTLVDINAKDVMDFTVEYNSMNDNEGALGRKWTHSYCYELDIRDEAAYFVKPSGEAVAFVRNAATGEFTPETAQREYSLMATAEGHIVRSVDNIEYVFEAHLAEIRQNNITQTRFTRNGEGQLTAIIGRYGSTIALVYSNGNITAFKYNSAGLLAEEGLLDAELCW